MVSAEGLCTPTGLAIHDGYACISKYGMTVGAGQVVRIDIRI
jgi:hypothetical protein